ncbi:MAG: tripartite tricarboxylate transporter substrate-binding protein [Filomicrobium sp.]
MPKVVLGVGSRVTASIVTALFAFFVAALLPVSNAHAAWKPWKPIKFIVMAGKGGGADKAVRFLVKTMKERKLVDVPFEIINIPGNSGGDAMARLQQLKGDNHAILFTLNSFYTTPIRQPELKIDISKFTPIARLAEDVFLLWVNAERQDINTIEDFVKAVREKGDTWVMSGTGTGAEDNLLTDFFNTMYGLNIKYRALKGGGAVAKELVGKKADSTVNNPSEQAKYYAQGLTKPIVAITPSRLEQFRSTPTLTETGMAFHYFMQRSVVGAPGMSRPARGFYEKLFKNLFNSPEWQGYRKKNSLGGDLLSGPELMKYWKKQREKHRRWEMTIELLQALAPAR